MNNFKISITDIPVSLLLFTMIIPYYFRIGPVQGTNLFYLVVLIVSVITYKKKIRLNYYTSMIFLWILVRMTINIYHEEYMYATTYLIKMLAIWYTVVCYISSESKIQKLIDKLINISILTGILGIIEALVHINVFSFLNNSGALLNYNDLRLGMVRILSFTSQTIHYAVFCAIMIFLIIYRLSYTQRYNEKVKYFCLLGLQFLNMMLTLSRSVIICFFICVFIMLLATGVKKTMKYFIVAIIGVLAFSLFEDSSIISQIVYMLLTPIFSKFGNLLASNWGTEDISGIGDRTRLYLWVYDSVKNNLLLGLGETNNFAYTHTIYEYWGSYNVTKTSIEVNYLNLLYHYGVVGMVIEILMYVFFLLKSFFSNLKRKTVFAYEKNMKFSWILFIILLLELMSWFAVMAGEEVNFIYTLMFIWSCTYSKANETNNAMTTM